MFVEAGLASQKDVEAGLEVQKMVRGELGQGIADGKPVSPDQLPGMINQAYKEYEKMHPDYQRPQGEQHARIDFGKAMPDGRGASLTEHPVAAAMAEQALHASTEHGGRDRKETPERRVT
ncbi:MAG: hypothetical protein ACREJM_10575, partial [Candidatus Saccharimonadales bacterium]